VISFQTILKLKGFPVTEAKRQLQSFYKLDRAEQKKWIDSKKEQIVDFHLKNNPLYKKQTIQSSSSLRWSELPILQKKDLQGNVSEMISDAYKLSEVYVSNTSGSSGHPFFFAKDKFSHALTWAFILNRYESLDIHPGDWQARFYGIPLDKISYAKEKVKDFFMHRVRFPVFDMGDAMLEKFLTQFQNTKIHYVYGYTNAVLLFSQFVLRNGIRLAEVCPTLKRCIVTSEVCREEDKKVIEEALGVPVIREYGASELDVIAIEDVAGRWAINEANLFVEVLSEDNRVLPMGEPGRLVITSLHNRAMPFIRYDIGDIGVLEEDERGVVLKTLSGRVNDTIILPSGKKSPGLTFYYVSRSILESSGVLKEFIIRQTALNSFEFDVVSERALTPEETRDIHSKMDLYLEPGLSLKINRVEKIQRPGSGKIKHFYSELKA
jgi:phenylacetate-CoA ligase